MRGTYGKLFPHRCTERCSRESIKFGDTPAGRKICRPFMRDESFEKGTHVSGTRLATGAIFNSRRSILHCASRHSTRVFLERRRRTTGCIIDTHLRSPFCSEISSKTKRILSFNLKSERTRGMNSLLRSAYFPSRICTIARRNDNLLPRTRRAISNGLYAMPCDIKARIFMNVEILLHALFFFFSFFFMSSFFRPSGTGCGTRAVYLVTPRLLMKQDGREL